MPSRRRKTPLLAPADALFAVAARRRVPFDFVLDELADLGPHTKPMFGCTAVYVDDRIVFILRDRTTGASDNGVWVATTREHHESLRAELPCMRSLGTLGANDTGWQVLPVDHADFEAAVLRACALVKSGDPRIGKVPNARRPRAKPAAKKG